MVMKGLRAIKWFIRLPATQFTVGMVLVVSSGLEVLEDIRENRALHLRAHHGVLLLGLMQAMSALPDLIDGLEKSFDAWDKRAQEKQR